MKLSHIVTIVLLLIFSSAKAQQVYQLQNRWKSNEYIHVEQITPSSGAIQPGWLSAQWIFEPVSGTSFYKIKNKWRNQYLHIEKGSLICSTIEPGWYSAQWSLEPVAGTSFYRIRNRWKPQVAMHNQNGKLEAGSVDLGWWSAQWQTVKPGSTPSSSGVVTQTTSTPLKRSDNPGAFKPEHNGRIETAVVRYTDRIYLIGNTSVSKGNKIYFFKQEVVVSNKNGLSFDPKNPAIGGQVFTVVETEPKLKLDRPMPMMRNTDNSSFSFVVEVY
ncbi:hypothetical protein [Reichenbachiella sp. MALMAid0571]|uniref:RICIN domain-containing protein n=1 Tax=Reichenbachiella sp. MALMAid0571 TaxID=3143939 RepID=UPI0032DF65E4